VRHLGIWAEFALDWCEHKPSITINVKEDDWMQLGATVFDIFDIISGVAFLPYDDHTYAQAPYQQCTEQEYTEALAKMPEKIDWHELNKFEKNDTTIGMQTMACSGDFCELVDLT
jgi:ribonucleoside-diphosphate reductase alpha chain